ncbi:MarR family winged helix-turn-helix transcriptional regulator [Marinilactibacillus psychrotolerans]|uniref:HTH-type transcriptional regulator SarZ n=1 Tax=Marinilactibacillus psychrotolerans TaxID=191770 RepID=A0A511GZ00_9LACT|nr:MarR family transcriptional regulator [Marinilactibacillus psychrotolerans]TLQ04556.1 MarR family transcriptional regulator [Marinilactibacillus psychrotolerans]SDC52433.1 transcriptional regulator [Marinilactibacillus psychrotolerans]GEL66500.1 organic hydroperoxide resistance transcriptional regulator [Marinilactibacillus psychrotolerans]GEQ33782.1 MarR family transcriptional regulator [Marinilactibacillus psychrotolerans]GEQ35316.1 MarR family transcriptional regulator [Marinilactibacill
MANELLKLENQLCFSLYASTRQMTKIYRPLLKELNITYPQYLTLLVLWEVQTISVKSLGERLFLDSGTLTPMLKRMEENGLITRVRSTSDERVVEISLTKKGIQAEDKAESIPVNFIKHLNLEEEEFLQLKKILAKMMDNFDK